jgi:hypothetical protein
MNNPVTSLLPHNYRESDMSTIAKVLTYDQPGDVTLTKEMSPKTKARLAGALFLVTIVAGIFAQGYLSDVLLVVPGNAAATAHNIAANQSILRIAFMILMIEMSCQVGTTAVMYDLLMPVDRSLARASAAFGYVASGIKTMSRVFFYGPLLVLGGSSYLSAFDPKQLDAISYLLIRLNNQGAGIALIFFGVNTVLLGLLMIRATFLPRVLGILSLVAGFGWLTWVYPPLGSKLFTPVALFALIGCFAQIGWFLIRGVDERKWYEMAAATSSSIWR